MAETKHPGAALPLSILFGGALSVAVTLGLLAVCAASILGERVSESALSLLLPGVSLVSGLAGGILAAVLGGRHRLPLALGAAAVWLIFCVLMWAGGLSEVDTVPLSPTPIRLGAGLLGGGLAGIFAAKPKNRRK